MVPRAGRWVLGPPRRWVPWGRLQAHDTNIHRQAGGREGLGGEVNSALIALQATHAVSSAEVPYQPRRQQVHRESASMSRWNGRGGGGCNASVARTRRRSQCSRVVKNTTGATTSTVVAHPPQPTHLAQGMRVPPRRPPLPTPPPAQPAPSPGPRHSPQAF
jgi:hypothetical protein